MNNGIPLYLLCGTLAGINGLIFGNPFDVMRTVQLTHKGQGRLGLVGAVRLIWTKNGFFGFYKGFNSNTWRVAGWNAINFTIFQKIENDYSEYKQRRLKEH